MRRSGAQFLALLGRELKGFFYSPVAGVVMFCFLLLAGVAFHASVSVLNQGGLRTPLVALYFDSLLFWVAFLLSFPLVTMRMFAEEFRMGTIETLATAPVTDAQIVFSKYAAALLFQACLWAPGWLCFLAFERLTPNRAAPAAGAYVSTYLLLALVSACYTAAGCLVSALTRNQIIAAVGTLCLVLLLFFGGQLPGVTLRLTPLLAEVAAYVSTPEHVQAFARGWVDTRPMVFYGSGAAFFLFLTFVAYQSRKWRA